MSSLTCCSEVMVKSKRWNHQLFHLDKLWTVLNVFSCWMMTDLKFWLEQRVIVKSWHALHQIRYFVAKNYCAHSKLFFFWFYCCWILRVEVSFHTTRCSQDESHVHYTKQIILSPQNFTLWIAMQLLNNHRCEDCSLKACCNRSNGHTH